MFLLYYHITFKKANKVLRLQGLPVPPALLLPIATDMNFIETDSTGMKQTEMGSK